MFDGTLGDWDTESVDLDLNPDFKMFNNKYYPVPRIYKENFFKELNRLVKMGVLTPVQHSQYGTPIFIITNEGGTVRFITDYHRLEHKLAIKPNTLLKIGKNLQQLEGFQYVTALDINMGYYNIRLSPAS